MRAGAGAAPPPQRVGEIRLRRSAAQAPARTRCPEHGDSQREPSTGMLMARATRSARRTPAGARRWNGCAAKANSNADGAPARESRTPRSGAGAATGGGPRQRPLRTAIRAPRRPSRHCRLARCGDAITSGTRPRQKQPQDGLHLSARDRHVKIVAQRGREALRRKCLRRLQREALFNASNCVRRRFDTPGASRMIGLIQGTSVRVGESGSKNPSRHTSQTRGITPTMVCGSAISRRVRPTAEGLLRTGEPQFVIQHHDRFGLAVRPEYPSAGSCGRLPEARETS